MQVAYPPPMVAADTPRSGTNRTALRHTGICLLFVVLSVAYTHPLLWRLTDGIPVDAGDPGLNASILHWNARTLPFSSAWWNAPQYFPTDGVASFTESMVGFAPFASPVIWLTDSAVAGYNVAFFLTWPLTAIAVYFLVWRLSRRHDAAFIAGLACAFNPFRYYEGGHLQMLATEWLPLLLLGCHAYVEDRRTVWLPVVAAAWLLNSFSNGHFMLFGVVLVGAWLVYFGSTRTTWRRAAVLGGTFALASLPLVPVFLEYQKIHDYFNLHRHESEIIYYSAEPSSWARISYNIWLWSKFLPDSKDNFFPGITVLVLVVAGIGAVLWQRREPASLFSAFRRRSQVALSIVLAISAAFTISALCFGDWEWYIGELRLFKMTEMSRGLITMAICTIALVAMTRSLREAILRRSALMFYVGGMFLCAILACGPMLRVGEEVILEPMPYRWLMSLPGFMELRVPARFWMFGAICLSVAAGLAFRYLRPSQVVAARFVFTAVIGFILLDSWIPSMAVAGIPGSWPIVESPERMTPILELPIGPDDYGATFRTSVHRRRVVNGVSGYNPPYYLAMAEGLTRVDPGTLAAIASYSPIDVVVKIAEDPVRRIRGFVTKFPGAQQVAFDPDRVLFTVPQTAGEPDIGPALPIASVYVREGANVVDAVDRVHDGLMDTGWGETPQTPDQQVLIDLGTLQNVGGVSHAIGDYYLDFPRRLAVDLSADGSTWTKVWDSPTMGPMMWAWVRAPRVADMRMLFAPQQARYVRLRQTEEHFRMWRISEVNVHGPVQ